MNAHIVGVAHGSFVRLSDALRHPTNLCGTFEFFF